MSDEWDDEERAHSELGASGAHRWRPCPGSVALSRGLPDNPSIFAAEGTVFHEVASWCLELGLEPHGFIGTKIDVPPFGLLTFDKAMANHMVAGLDFLRAVADSPGARMLVETRLNLGEWTLPGEFGTADAIVMDPTNWRMTVFDWKYGAGVPVSPDENPQAILYALGAWSTVAGEFFYDAYLARGDENTDLYSMPDVEVHIVIEQPRAQGGGGVWKTTLSELLAEGEKIRQDALRTKDPNAPLVPGDKQCKFCRAARFNACEARAKFVLSMAMEDFDALDQDFDLGVPLVVPQALSPEARSQVLLHKGMIEKFLEQLHKEAYHDAQHGRPVPGMKLILGRSPARAWTDPDKAAIVLERRLGAEAYHPPKLLSPAQVEETVGKKAFKDAYANFVRTGEGQPILVPESHKGERITSPQEDFDALLDTPESDDSII